MKIPSILKRTRLTLGAALAAMSFTLTTTAVPWVSRHGMTGASYQNEFNTWTSAPFNYRLVCIAGYEQSGQARYAAVWEKRPGPGWFSHHGMSEAGFESLRASYAGQNFHPVFISGFGVGSSAYYNAIWEYAPGADVVSEVGLSYSTYVSLNTTRISQGYKLVHLWTFNAGSTEYFCAIWRKGVATGYAVRLRRTAASYQTEFDDLGSQGYQLVSVSSALVGGQDLYTGVWKKPGDGVAWYSFHGLTPANYQGETWNAYYQGFRPVFASAFNGSGGLRFNAIFHHNGGLAPGHLATISDAINTYLQDNSVPGCSVAISKNGRLVYARGFGLADQSVGELVHPHHRFRIASVSKPITSAGILKLRDQGSLGLDQTVFGSGALLGTLYGTPPYSTRELNITVRHLLHHTSGWTSDGQLWNNAYGTDHEAILDWQLDNVNPSSAPGTSYTYNNMNYIAAGRIIEARSGKNYEQYIRDEILVPCCVSDMEIGRQTLAERRPGEVVYYGSNPYVNIHPGRMDANGGWIARPLDLLMFLRRINSASDQSDILSATSLTALRSGSTPNSGYGLGLILNSSWWGHNGAMDGTIAFLVYRNDGMAFAFTCNTRPSADSFGFTLRGVIDGVINTLNAANAWPSYDLFPCPNPSYLAWISTKLPRTVVSEVQLKDHVWGPGADLDNDGLPNAVEAYFDFDPLRPNSSPLSARLEGSDFVVRWTRPSGDRGVELKSEYANSIEPRAWTDGPPIRTTGLAPTGLLTEETRMRRDTRPAYFQHFEVIMP